MDFTGANITAIADLLKTEEPESDSDEDMKVFIIMVDEAEWTDVLFCNCVLICYHYWRKRYVVSFPLTECKDMGCKWPDNEIEYVIF